MEQQTWIGRSLNGRYKIEALLGQGGMSAVYKAIDPNLKRTVAIKLIHPHLLADEDFIYRFKREAAAVAGFRHPNIVQVYDFNNDGDIYYMVLEFVPGETLQDRLKHLKKTETKMDYRQATRIMLNMCDALDYAHTKGMIHRDIKPANIMLDTRGQAILMDFGIVKIMDATSHTSTGAVMGTARYMSPEVIRSEAADARSDLYSLGVTFYEMLSGDPPFDADSAMSLLMRHLNDPVPDLSIKRDDLPIELVDIVNKALEKNREDRYQSAEEMIDGLKHFMATLETVPVKTVLPTPKDSTQAETRKSAPKTIDEIKPPETSSPIVKQPEASLNIEEQTIPDLAQQAAPKAPQAQPKAQPQQTYPPRSKTGVIGAVIGLVVVAVITGIFLANRNSGAGNENTPPTATITASQSEPEATAVEQVVQATATEEVLPTTTPTETPIPLTPTPSTPYVLITNIGLENSKYIVDYEVHNFPEAPALHVHMFFNTVPPEQAGSPASGPWKLTWGAYGDPPFTQYGPANRPAQATQMCALVANTNHTIILNSGNCFDLPEG